MIYKISISFLKRYIHSEYIVKTVCWGAYNELTEHFAKHHTVNYSKYFQNQVALVNTNTIEGNWSGIKDQVSKRHRIRKLNKTYLVRFMILRIHPTDTFEAILKMLFSYFFSFLFPFF